MNDHSKLAQKEGDENSAGVQRKQMMLASVEGQYQKRCSTEKDKDSVGIVKPEASGYQLPWKVAVLSHDGQKEGKTCKGGISSKSEDDYGHDLDNEVEGASFAEDGSSQKADCGLLIIGNDLIHVDQSAYSKEDDGNESGHGVEYSLGILR